MNKTTNAVLVSAKAYAALLGAIATALLGTFTADTPIGKVLTVVAVIATAVVTWRVPNLDPEGTHQDESVQPSGDGEEQPDTPYVEYPYPDEPVSGNLDNGGSNDYGYTSR